MCKQDQIIAVSVEDLKIITLLAQLTGTEYGVQKCATDATDVDYALTNLTSEQFEIFQQLLKEFDIYYETPFGMMV